LYISFNELDELFDISMLENLQVLDIEGNNIARKEELMYLSRLQ
jgi:Leucine-rich repeat (LRR) protein